MITFLLFLICTQMVILLNLVSKIVDKLCEPDVIWSSGTETAQFIDPISDKERFDNAKSIDDLIK